MKNWKKTFYTIWMGQAVSQLTSSILQFAIVWYLTDTTKSGVVLSLAMLVGFLPQGVLGPVIGVFIDRYSRKKIMIFSDLFIAIASLMLVFISLGGAIPTGAILLVLLLRAIGTAFHTPTLQAVTPQLVPKEELTKCAGYSQSLQSISQIISPAIAAALYSNWNLQGIIFLDVLGALVAVCLLITCKIPTYKSEHSGTKINIIKETIEGFSILNKKKGMLGLVLVGSLYTIALMPISALFPLMCMGYFGGTSANASTVEIIFAIGYLFGAVILGRWGGTKNKVHTIVGSYVLMAFTLLMSGLLPNTGFVWFVVLAGLMGISGPFYWGMYTPILQQNFAENYLGRIMAITSSMRLITGPIGLVVSGICADRFGVEKWFVVAGILVLVAILICIGVPSIRNCDK